MELIALILAFIAGYIVACWVISSKTGQPMSQILRGKPGEEGPP